MDQKFKQIAKLFQRLPGVGPRQAARFVLALLSKPEHELTELGQAIQNLKQLISFCKNCFNLSDGNVCNICSDSKRDQTKILVIEKATDLDSLEKTGLYKGLYHVLGGSLNPLEGLTQAHLKINELQRRIEKTLEQYPSIELILATNPTPSGETTALYLRELFKEKEGISITRLARGLASGSHLEYTDESTLKNALEYRK